MKAEIHTEYRHRGRMIVSSFFFNEPEGIEERLKIEIDQITHRDDYRLVLEIKK